MKSCYNAETVRNNLRHKGLLVVHTWLNRTTPLLGLTAALLANGLFAPAAAQTTTPRGPSESQVALSLPAVDSTPAAEPVAARSTVTHTVRRGETLSSIARRYGTSVASLKSWNGLRGNTIQAGRRLSINGSRAASTTVGRRERARLARVARAAALREAEEPRFKLDEQGAMVPDLRAEAAIIYSPDTGKVLWEENAQDQRSIASITKIMTAAVFLEDDPDVTREIVVQRSDVFRASTTYLRAGY